MSRVSCATAALPGCSSTLAARRSSSKAAARRPRLALVTRAQEGGSPSPQQQEQQQQLDAAAEERRLEALEAAARTRRGVKAEQADALRGSRPARASSSTGMAEWKEGQLFPEGWEEMDPLQKATELYMGKRGVLYWSQQAATYSVGILVVGWVLFRFVGPALGLYTLTNDLSTPNLGF